MKTPDTDQIITAESQEVIDLLSRLERIMQKISARVDIIHHETQTKLDKHSIKKALEDIHNISE